MLIPIHFLICMILNKPCKHFLIWTRILPNPNRLPTTHSQADAEQWDDAIELMRDNLTTFSNLCSSCVHMSSVGQSRHPTLQGGIQLCVSVNYSAMYSSLQRACFFRLLLLTIVPMLVATTMVLGGC